MKKWFTRVKVHYWAPTSNPTLHLGTLSVAPALRSRASGAVRGRPRPLYYTAHHAILGGLLTSPHWLTKVCPETLLLLHASRVPFTCFAPAVAVTFVTAKTAPVGGRVGTRVITNQLVGMRVPA